MTITPEAPAKTLTQLVATEIRVQMARADVKQSQLAREIGKTEQWLSVRLRGRQPIDVNDLALIAKALKVGVHQLLPPPDVAAGAAPSTTQEWYRAAGERPLDQPKRQDRPRDTRPSGHPAESAAHRTARLPRGRGPNR